MLLSLYDIVQRCEHDIFAGYCAIGVIIITMMMMMIIMMMTMKCLVPLGFLPRTRVCVIVCMCVFVCVCLCVCVCVCVMLIVSVWCTVLGLACDCCCCLAVVVPLHDGTAHWALPDHYTFSDLDIISRSQQCQTVLTENWKYVLIHFSTIFVGLLGTLSRSWIYCYFKLSHIFRGGNWHVSWFDKKKNVSLALSQTLFKQGSPNFALLQPCLGRTNSYQVWRPCFNVTGVSES